MANILYGVAGEGFGHSSRSEMIARRLIEAGHNVQFAASEKSLSYLSPLFPGRVHQVYGLRLVYRNGKVHPFDTAVLNLARYGEGFRINCRLFHTAVKNFAPDLVISDFEPFCGWWACRHRVPCVFIDHQHVLTMTYLDRVGCLMERLRTSCIIRGYHTFAKKYVAINFFRVPTTSRKVVLINPVIRDCVTQLKTGNGHHITSYTTDPKPETKQRLISLFSEFPSRLFYVYGFNVDQQHKNCFFKKTSTEGFLHDLACGAGVISTAGFSLISESLYLKKRMMLMPVIGQYEQQLNAAYAQKLGFARSTDQINPETLRLFLDDLDKDFPSDERILWPDNERFFDTLNETFNNLGFYLGLSRKTS